MKKLVAISVLVAGLAAAAFAQDEGKWKFGFSTTFVTDMLYVTSASGKSTKTDATGTVTKEFGSKNKGTIIWFDNAKYTDSGNPPQALATDNARMLLSVSNSGENYEVYADIAFDNWHNEWGGVLDFLGNGSADWYMKGSAGIFDAQIGSHWFNTQGGVSAQSVYSVFVMSELSRFGVYHFKDGWVASNTFRTWPEWGNTATVGIHLGDNFKFTLGYKLNPGYSPYPDQANSFADAWASKSSINGAFMLSGQPVDALSFDLFYAIMGKDSDTFERSYSATGGYAKGDGSWRNTAGVYLGINAIENLGLSLGYTAGFNVYETGTYLDPADVSKADAKTLTKPVTYNAPINSGIDIRLSYSGIENIGLTFNNNISLASVKGEKVDGYKDKLTLLFDETTYNAEGRSQDWFQLHSQLKVSFGFIEGVDLGLYLEDRIGVTTNETALNGNTFKSTTTNNKFRATLRAAYGVGGMTLGASLVLDLDSTKLETSNSNPNTSFTGESTVLKFGIPLVVSMAF